MFGFLFTYQGTVWKANIAYILKTTGMLPFQRFLFFFSFLLNTDTFSTQAANRTG